MGTAASIPGDWLIRRLGPADREELGRAFCEAFRGPPWNEIWTAEAALAAVDEWLPLSGYLGLTAIQDGRIVAFAFGRLETWARSRLFYLKEFCVLPGWQRRGIGAQLAVELEAAVAAEGATFVYLHTLRDSEAAAFYARQGYVVGERMIMMGKTLGAADGIRAALPEEAAEISALALRSKAHWGYGAAQMEVFRGELTLEPPQIRPRHTHVLVVEGRLAGFYTLVPRTPEEFELEHLFVEPMRLRCGHGRELWNHACRLAEEAGARRLVVQSDPHAAGFYERLGARRVREIPSSLPGRSIPLFAIELNPAAVTPG